MQKYDAVQIAPGADFGNALNHALAAADGWILFQERDGAGASEIKELIRHYILNPGTLHCGNEFFFFHKDAHSLRRFGFDRIAHTASFMEIRTAWQKEKVVSLSDVEGLTRWKRVSIVPGKRYVIWGTGLSGSFIADAVESSGGDLLFAIDRDPAKEGSDFYGVTIHTPEYLKEHMEGVEHLLIGHYSRFEEIRTQALVVGVPADKIMMPYEV